MRFGCNFWLEGPIDIIRPTRLNCILQDLFRDKFGGFWDWNVRLILHCVLPHPITIKSILFAQQYFLWPIPLKRCFEDSYSYKLTQYNFKYSYIKKNCTVSSSETRSIEISLVLTGEALLGCKVGKPCKCFFLGWEQTVCGWKSCKCQCWHWKIPSEWTPQACNVPFWNNQRAGDQFEEIIPCWVGTTIIFDLISHQF